MTGQQPEDMTAGEFREWFAMADHNAEPSDWLAQVLSMMPPESDSEKLERLQAENARLREHNENADYLKRTWRPGMELKPDAPVSLDKLKADYERELAEGLRYGQFRRDRDQQLDAEAFRPGTAEHYPGTLADPLNPPGRPP